MAEYTIQKDKNGNDRYYRIEDGKKTAVKKAEYDANAVKVTVIKTKKEDKNMKFKQSRWTKVHKQGEGSFGCENNVMDITVGANMAQADILYSTKMVRTIEKAAHWLLHSLEVAKANDVVELAAESIREKAAAADKAAEQITVEGDGWYCTIESMGAGEFKAHLTWTFEDEEYTQLAFDLGKTETA